MTQPVEHPYNTCFRSHHPSLPVVVTACVADRDAVSRIVEDVNQKEPAIRSVIFVAPVPEIRRGMPVFASSVAQRRTSQLNESVNNIADNLFPKLFWPAARLAESWFVKSYLVESSLVDSFLVESSLVESSLVESTLVKSLSNALSNVVLFCYVHCAILTQLLISSSLPDFHHRDKGIDERGSWLTHICHSHLLQPILSLLLP